MHYVEEREETIGLRDHNCPTHINQYFYISLVVLDSIAAFINFICIDQTAAKNISDVIKAVGEEINCIYKEIAASDNEIV